MAKSSSEHLIAVNKALKEAVTRHKQGIQERGQSSILVSPDEIRGTYDHQRNLLTSLGNNGLRPITQDDLAVFRASAKIHGKKAAGGITAQRMLDTSMPGPRDRAHREIHTALVIRHKGGLVTFQTNAGPNSKVRRHMVSVEFQDFEDMVVAPVEAKAAAGRLIKGKLKIDCNCEDWRYRLRYIATTGGWAAGPWFEHSYPKITNPLLTGCGCKHVLRVMTTIIASPTFKAQAVKLIEGARTAVERVAKTRTVKQMKADVEKMQKETHRQRRVTTTADKKAERERWRLNRAMKAGVADAKKAAEDKARKQAAKDARTAISQTKKAIKQAQDLADNPRTSAAVRALLLGEIADRQADLERLGKK
ncbi:hypothetical protein [Pseudomonas sp.]|jgi:hypothetical protein|uniref:hypothetical protein n=1 Tax=Pseudomonas sp. TaxID=306 RepID=UPI002EDA4D3A